MSGHKEGINAAQQLIEARAKRIEEINRNWADYANQTTFATNEAEEGLLDAYFAKRKIEKSRTENVGSPSELYKFRSRMTIVSDENYNRIVTAITNNYNENLESQDLYTTEELVASVLENGEYPKDTELSVPVMTIEETEEFIEIKSGVLGRDAYIFVKGFALKDKEATIEIFERSPFLLMEDEIPLTVIQYDTIEAEEPNENTNKTELKAIFNDRGEAVVKIKFRPKVEDPDTIYSEWKEKFTPKEPISLPPPSVEEMQLITPSVPLTFGSDVPQIGSEVSTNPEDYPLPSNQKPELPPVIDFLWLKVKVSGDKQDYDEEFLNENNDSYFKLKVCNCGKKYDGQFRCTRYGRTVKVYGPIYNGSYKLKDYAKWNEIISKGIVTSMEKDIFIIMSPNEGNLDSVQSYDSEIVTAGAMQKTINPTGQGEFPIQVAEFKNSNAEKYVCLFESCGWTVENNTMFYKDPDDPNAQKITGSDLKRKIREGFDASTFGSRIKCKPLEPIVNAVNDNDFQVKQIEDFISRLRDRVLPIVPRGYSHTLGDFLISRLGRATALDHHINRPAYVRNDLGDSLNNFFARNPNVSENPLNWGDNHQTYETAILEDYGVTRRGTDMAERFNKMRNR
ncbi:hypothetical protein [Aquimarina latercula]|uniref:hypothetical protein n=1 Tax=Aquimarina latercula TaxID=987 RepID=UPI00041DF885|nr:hypothetical protein [Aquimarina latercula]